MRTNKQKPDSQLTPVQLQRRRRYIEDRERILARERTKYHADDEKRKDRIVKVNEWRERTDDGKNPLFKQGKAGGKKPIHVRLPTTTKGKKAKPSAKIAKPGRKVIRLLSDSAST